MNNKEAIILTVLILFTVVVSYLAGHSTGYYIGQRDAKDGHYRYGYETNVTYTANGKITTNVTWRVNK